MKLIVGKAGVYEYKNGAIKMTSEDLYLQAITQYLSSVRKENKDEI